jgi:hypothetical protein
MVKRLAKGDVVSIPQAAGAIYLQFVGKHPEYGDAVAVCPTVMPADAAVSSDLFQAAYIAFYPLHVSLRRGYCSVAGRLPLALEVPSRLRRVGAMSGRRILTWIIEDPPGEEVVLEALSPSEATIPIAAIWNHEFLLARVGAGWRPEKEVGEGAPHIER